MKRTHLALIPWLSTVLIVGISVPQTGCNDQTPKGSSNPAASQGSKPASAGATDKPLAEAGPSQGKPPEVAAAVPTGKVTPAALPAAQDETASAAGTIATPKSGLGAVLASALNVRPMASTNNQPLGRIHCGDVIALSGKEGVWYKVKLGALSGYAHSSYIVEVSAGTGRVPTCEFDHVHIKPKAKAKPQPIPSLPTANPLLAEAAKQKPELKAVPELVPVIVPPPAPVANVPTPPPSTPTPNKPVQAIVKVPQNLKLSASGIKGTIDFPHAMHSKQIDCVKCHHPISGAGPGANLDKNCHSCHKSNGAGTSPVSSKDAFHQTCRSCHEAQGKGPTTCSECHTGIK